MKKYILLVLTILSFIVFQIQFKEASNSGYIISIEVQDKRAMKYIGKPIPVSKIVDIKTWMTYNNYEVDDIDIYLPIHWLFQTAYGYIFLGLFTLSGYLIKPRKVWIPVSIGIYIGLALLFTFF